MVSRILIFLLSLIPLASQIEIVDIKFRGNKNISDNILFNLLISQKDDEFQIILHDYDDATRALRTAVEEDEKEKLKLKVDKLKDSTEVIRRKLKSLNLQQNNVKNNLEKFCRDSGMYPDNDD